MNKYFYPIAHAGVDFCCALLLFRFFRSSADFQLLLLLYNFCAFALQLPIGLWADRMNRNHLFAGAGMLLVTLAYFLSGIPLFGACCAGLGNALFHIGGGLEALNEGKKAAPLGRFVAPGALGLFLGTAFGKTDLLWLWAPLLLGTCGLLLLLLKTTRTGNAVPALPTSLPVLGGLFFVVLLRSYLGFTFRFSWNTTFLTGLAVALAVPLGKACGGYLLDRLGWCKTVLCTMLPAAVCLFFGEIPALGLAGILLFQTTMPLTLWGAARLCPGLKGFSFGLLTLALFLGFLPVFFQFSMPDSPWVRGLGALISGALLLPCERRLTSCAS